MLYMKVNNLIILPLKDNGISGLLFIIRNVWNKIFNMIFYRRHGVYLDCSSFIYGIKYMRIGSLYAGRDCRIEVIPRYLGRPLNPLLKIGHRVCLNDNVHIGCSNYVEIGNDCLFASRIYISDHNHGYYKGDNQSMIEEKVAERDIDNDKTVVIGSNVWIGEGVSILPGSKIGNNSIVGANSVVSGYIPENCIAVGIPAKVIKTFDKKTKKWVRYKDSNE